jgi:hypothetical protein
MTPSDANPEAAGGSPSAPASAAPAPGPTATPGPAGTSEVGAANGRDRAASRSRGRATEERSRNRDFPQRILNIGFLTALALAGASLLMGALYLSVFLWRISSSVQGLLADVANRSLPVGSLEVALPAQANIAKVTLLSCAIFVGMAFGFLGFSLFLIGIRAEMDVEASSEAYQVKLARLSPGVFVILCATLLIGVCAVHEVDFRVEAMPGTPAPKADLTGATNQVKAQEQELEPPPDPGPAPETSPAAEKPSP